MSRIWKAKGRGCGCGLSVVMKGQSAKAQKDPGAPEVYEKDVDPAEQAALLADAANRKTRSSNRKVSTVGDR